MIKASPQQLNHAFLNLINNSIEAMEGETTLTNGWRSRTSGKEINIKTNLRKENIMVQISDTGPGILPEDIEHIFDPFYTNKKQMGIGVGLSVCYDLIEDHGGNINVVNAPEGGAVFTITLPVSPNG